MANLPESATYPGGIYQIETTDPVVGGPDGISNVQAKQLASRTKYLKQFADEVEAARGESGALGDRLAGYDAFSPEQQTTIVGVLQEALGTAGVLSREIDVIRRRVLAQGIATIKNKYVIQGFTLSKSDIRALDLSLGGTVGSGVSRAQIDGMIVSLGDDDYHVSVPTNETDEARSYYAYLVNIGGSAYGVEIAAQVPDDALGLYRLDVPAGDVANNLDNVTLVDLRVTQSSNGWLTSFVPLVIVAFDETLPAADYAVALEVEDATNVAAVGALTAYDKATNGFKIRQSGSADNVRVRWTLLNTRYQ